ncbi:YgaP family membrane protein [Fluviicola sp.]|uniref:YgaP family membrane protein n=1 Tax=Fluviicola sp. TaxID=1917219 RepID=UPI003D2C0C7A
MKMNMHTIDRIIRVLLALAIVTLYFSGYLSGTLAIIALVVAVIFTLTSLIGFCPLYSLVGISTRKKSK